jgi:hypothetical protein
MRSGTALALVAEVLYMLGRYEEAVHYAREALPRLTAHGANEFSTRRLSGCYGILSAIMRDWVRPPGIHKPGTPGAIYSDEADNYRTVPELHMAATT